MKIWDVALQTNQGLFREGSPQIERWMLEERVPIAPDMWIGRLGSEIATEIMDGSEAVGKWPGVKPTRQYAELYSFVREVPKSDTDIHWDIKQQLQTAVAYSRLIHPTSISLGYAARIFFDDGGGIQKVVPGPVKGQAAFAFISEENKRDWLTKAELQELSDLLNHPLSLVPERIRLAFWYLQYAATTYYVEIRWPLVCTGLEALVETDRFNLTGQFVRRVPKLARDVGVAEFTEEDAIAAYQIRNSLVHGQGFINIPEVPKLEFTSDVSGFSGVSPDIKGVPERIRLYNRLEDVLRLALKKAISGYDFANLFKDEPAIRQHFEGDKRERRGSIQAVVGTRDILPPESESWGFVERTARDVFRLYGFSEVRTPIIEDLQLFQRAVGEETDIVAKEMFTWEDRGRTSREKEQWLALRPENTAGVVRAYIQNKLWDRGLNKLFYFGPQFRRERPQKGRYRQFYQIGAEVIGPPSSGSERPLRDAELIEMLDTLLRRIGIGDFTLQLNSIGDAKDRAAYSEALRKALEPVVGKMCPDCQRRAVTNPLRVFDCKVPDDQPMIQRLPLISEHLGQGSREHFNNVMGLLQSAGVDFTVNRRLVRGLDYYTRTAFEFTHGALGSQNAILGGGRYDGLSEALGGPPAPGIGFAIGEDRLVLALKEQTPTILRGVDAYVAPVGEGMNRVAISLAKELRRGGATVELGDRSFKLRRLLEIAAKTGSHYAVIVGENEANSDIFTLKNLITGEQFSVPRKDLARKILGDG